MKRMERTRILVNSSIDLALNMAKAVEAKFEVQLVEAPSSGMVLLKKRETAKQSLFYCGEVLVTEAKVQISGVLGLGIVQGDQPEKAYCMAVIDAAYRSGIGPLAGWEAELESARAMLEEQAIDAHQRLAKTAVDFQTMMVE